MFFPFLLYSKGTLSYTYPHSFAHFLLHPVPSQGTSQSSLGSTAGPHGLSTPKALVCIYSPQTPRPSHSCFYGLAVENGLDGGDPSDGLVSDKTASRTGGSINVTGPRQDQKKDVPADWSPSPPRPGADAPYYKQIQTAFCRSMKVKLILMLQASNPRQGD